MPSNPIAKYLNPWMFKREQKRRRFAELRTRDGDNCWRCRRPLRFDLPPGHDLAPRIEHLPPKPNGGTGELDNLCLCHGHCNRLTGDATAEVTERMRRKAEAALLVTARQKRRA